MEFNDHIPLSTSSPHALAEALVRRTQDSILATSAKSGEDAKDPDRSPLSVKLAAYGESFALERRLKEVEQGGDGAETVLRPRSSSFTQEPCQSSKKAGGKRKEGGSGDMSPGSKF